MLDQVPSPLQERSGSKVWCDFPFRSDGGEDQGGL